MNSFRFFLFASARIFFAFNQLEAGRAVAIHNSGAQKSEIRIFAFEK